MQIYFHNLRVSKNIYHSKIKNPIKHEARYFQNIKVKFKFSKQKSLVLREVRELKKKVFWKTRVLEENKADSLSF